MRYPPEFVDRVQEANNIADIIGQYTQLKQSGNGYMGRCPFPDHAEKTASFSVSESKQVYHCFGCKKSGNLFTFLKDYNGMNFPEAVEYLADRSGTPLPEIQKDQNDQYQVQQDKKKAMMRANKIASDFFFETLKRAPNDSPIKQYVQKRKLSVETIQEFQIGYAPTEWEGLSQHLHDKNISSSLAEEAKLVKARTGGNGHFDIFRDRLIFPILSQMGEVLAFGGRIIEQGEPKYLNSPETLVFHKNKVLYGLAHTAKYVRAEDAVVIVEGYMDLVSIFQAGIKNVAASMGTALTAEHAKIIKRLTPNVIVLFDSDEAGQRAAERSLPLLLAAGLYPRGLVLADAKDPDEFVMKFGVEALQKKIASAPELFNVVLHMWMGDYKGEASQKVKLMDLARPIFDAIPDNRLKSLYATELSQRMNVGIDWVRSAISGQPKATPGRDFNRTNEVNLNAANVPLQAKTEAEQPRKPVFLLSGSSQAEILLMQLSLKSRANFEVVLNQPGQQILSQITHLGVKALLEKAEQVYRQDLEKFDRLTSLLIDYVDKPELMFSNSSLGSTEFDEEKENKMIQDCCRRIQQTFLKEQVKKIALGLKQNVDDGMLTEISDLQKNRLSLNKNDK